MNTRKVAPPPSKRKKMRMSRLLIARPQMPEIINKNTSVSANRTSRDTSCTPKVAEAMPPKTRSQFTLDLLTLLSFTMVPAVYAVANTYGGKFE
jgi:hypothetical protein